MATDNLTIQNHMRVLSGTGALSRPEVPTVGPGGVEQPGKTEGPSFGETLAQSIEQLNTQMLSADRKATALATGESRDIHGTVIAMQKADISFRMMLTIRNKAMKAYEEVMRMQA